MPILDNQFQNYNGGNQRYNDYPSQANMRYNSNNFQGMENVRQHHTQFYQSDYYPTNVNFPGNFQQRNTSTSQNERENSQQNPIPITSQQAVSEPVTTTPSSVDLPPSGTITPQILDQTKVTRYQRVPELALQT